MNSAIKSVKLKYKMTLPEHKLVTLYQNTLQNIKTGLTCPVIQFTSAHHNEGASQIALETSIVAACKIGKRVLFIDGSLSATESLKFIAAAQENLENDPININIYETDIENLFVCRLYGSHDKHSAILPAEIMKPFFTLAKTSFDLIILYSEGALTNESTLNYSPLTEGVVIIVEAEKTRSPVVMQLKHILEQNGTNIIGCVLNKRQFHIPGWIHKFLFRS